MTVKLRKGPSGPLASESIFQNNNGTLILVQQIDQLRPF
jgi:hypothetical protein